MIARTGSDKCERLQVRGDRSGQRERPTHDQGPRQTALTAFKEAARDLTRRLSRLFRRHAPAKRQPRPLPG